jgi:hypothetical protein
MGDCDLCDGEWVWPEGLARYVERHAVRLPEDFVESMRSRSWTVPDVPEEPLMDDEEPEGGCYALDYSFWNSWATEGGHPRPASERSLP